MVQSTREPVTLLIASGTVITALLKKDQYAESLELALRAAPIAVAIQQPEAQSPRQSADVDVDALLGTKPSVLWNAAESVGAEWWLLPGTYRLALVALTDPERARLDTATVVGLCRQTALNASGPELWASAARLIEQVFLE